jgi:hypothetical protein
MLLSRRAFLARLGPVALWPLVAAHHRPGHARGPQPSATPTPDPTPTPSESATPSGGVFQAGVFQSGVFQGA